MTINYNNNTIELTTAEMKEPLPAKRKPRL